MSAESKNRGVADKVGYRKPPIRTRFKKGQSGNPKARPKKGDLTPKQIARELLNDRSMSESGKKRNSPCRTAQ